MWFVRRMAKWATLLIAAGVGWFAWPHDSWEARLGLARRAIAEGRLSDARDRLRTLIGERPDAARPRLLWVEVARRQGRPDEAEDALARAVELGLTAEEGRREFALLFAVRDFAKAEGALRRVLEQHPDDGEVHRALAVGYARAGRWKEARLVYSDWVGRSEGPDQVEALVGRARASWESGDWPAAEADFRRVLAVDPGDFRARILLADCLLNDARIAEAEPELEACRRLRPDRPEPLVGLAACASERGEVEEAGTLLDRALSLAPDFGPALVDRAKLLIARRRDDLARPLLERGVDLAPGDRTIRQALALLYRRVGEPGLADEQDRRARELEGEGTTPRKAP